MDLLGSVGLGLVMLAIGWVMRALLDDWATEHIERPLRRGVRRVSSRRSRGRDPYAVGELMWANTDNPVFVHTHAPSGLSDTQIECRFLPEMPTKERFAVRPDELRDVDEADFLDAVAAEHHRLADTDPTETTVDFDGDHLAVHAIRRSREGLDERPLLSLGFRVSSESLLRVVNRYWRSHVDVTALDRNRLEVPNPLLVNATGINLTVVTRDQRLIVTRRSGRTRAHSGKLHTSVNEGMTPIDLDSRRVPDPFATAWRGVAEELGVHLERDEKERARLVFHTVIVDPIDYGWAFLGHLDLTATSWTSSRVGHARQASIGTDDWETDEIQFIEWSTSELQRFLEGDEAWVHWGLLNIVRSAQIDGLPGARDLDTFLRS